MNENFTKSCKIVGLQKKIDLCGMWSNTAREEKMHNAINGQLSWINVQGSPQNTDDQHCFSMPCLFVLISDRS